MVDTEEKEETRIFLIGYAIIGFLMLVASFFTEPKLDLENGTIWEKPTLHRMSKSSEIRFTIKNSSGFSHKIRSVYPDLDQSQKNEILNLKRGTPVAFFVNNKRAYKNRKEIYAISTNKKIIYGIKEYEAFKKREQQTMIVWTLLFLILFFLYTKSKWKENTCLISFLAGIAMLAIIYYIKKGYSF